MDRVTRPKLYCEKFVDEDVVEKDVDAQKENAPAASDRRSAKGRERPTMSTHNTRGKSKSNTSLKLLPVKPPPRLTLGGMEPSDDMGADEYKIVCEGASKKSFAGSLRVELKFRVFDGPHAGTALRQWITLDASGVISPGSRYVAQCAIALGRPVDYGDDINDPGAIFSGQIFRARVGFRKTDKPRGGNRTDGNDQRRKDSSDGLRVHDLLAREEL